MKQNRRDFMKYGLGLGLGSVGALGCNGGMDSFHKAFGLTAEKRKSAMKFGLVTYKWGEDWDLPTLLANCEKTKVLGVELRTTHAHGVEPSLGAAQRKEVKKRFADSAVTLVGLGSAECFDHPEPEKLSQAIEATKAFLQLSADLGASGVKVRPNKFHAGVPKEITIEQIGKSLQALGPVAAGLNQQIRLEVHGDCAVFPYCRQIMDIAAHPSVAICWNSNKQDLEGAGLVENFNSLKNRFGGTAHVRELNTPDYPFQQLMDLFVGMNYSGWILLEAGSKPADRVKALEEQRLIWEHMVDAAIAKRQKS